METPAPTHPDTTPAATPQSDLAPRGYSEARLDLLLGEELQVNPDFARWFAGPAIPASATLADPWEPVVRFNVWDEGGPPPVSPGEAGENDLDIALPLADGTTVRLLIEDKVWAPFQPEQGRRYQARARSRPNTTAVLVAPEARLAADATESRYFKQRRPVEALADFLAAQADSRPECAQLASRLRWRADLLRRLCTRILVTDDEPTIQFRNFCANWLAEQVPEAVPAQMRAAGGGWLWFNRPASLGYKVNRGLVDLYVVEEGFTGTLEGLERVVAEGGAPAGFVAATDNAKKPNIVLRWNGQPLHPNQGIPDDTGPLIEGLEACVRAVKWLASEPAVWPAAGLTSNATGKASQAPPCS